MTHTDRRRFLLNLAGLFGIAAFSPELRGASQDGNELSIDFDAPGQRIPENFLITLEQKYDLEDTVWTV